MKNYGDLAQWLLVFRWVGSVVPLAVTHVGSSRGSLRQGYAKNGCPYEYPVQSVGTVGTLVLVSVMSGVNTDVSINASDSARIPLRSTLRG